MCLYLNSACPTPLTMENWLMANDCYFLMKVVAKNEDAIRRLVSIMNAEDGEFYAGRIFYARMCGEIQRTEDGFCVVEIEGDSAWNCIDLFCNVENEGQILNGAHFISLDLLCPKLDVAVELYSEECGNEFQEWIACDHNGNLVSDIREWSRIYEDEDGNELDEPIEEGGFGEDYCQFKSPDRIWQRN